MKYYIIVNNKNLDEKYEWFVYFSSQYGGQYIWYDMYISCYKHTFDSLLKSRVIAKLFIDNYKNYKIKICQDI